MRIKFTRFHSLKKIRSYEAHTNSSTAEISRRKDFSMFYMNCLKQFIQIKHFVYSGKAYIQVIKSKKSLCNQTHFFTFFNRLILRIYFTVALTLRFLSSLLPLRIYTMIYISYRLFIQLVIYR